MVLILALSDVMVYFSMMLSVKNMWPTPVNVDTCNALWCVQVNPNFKHHSHSYKGLGWINPHRYLRKKTAHRKILWAVQCEVKSTSASEISRLIARRESKKNNSDETTSQSRNKMRGEEDGGEGFKAAVHANNPNTLEG